MIWKNTQYDNFEVSNTGLVRNISMNSIKISRPCQYGYLHIKIKGKYIKVHKLVAEAFIGESNGLDVNHIDGDKLNNNVENLEYISRYDNLKHAWRNGLMKRNTFSKIIQKDLQGNIVKIFDTFKDVSDAGFYRNGVSDICYGRGKTYKGFKWEGIK